MYNLLTLLHNLLQDMLFTIQKNKVGLRHVNFLEDISISILIFDKLFDNKPEFVHRSNLASLFQNAFYCHKRVIVLNIRSENGKTTSLVSSMAC